jgi:hypothetical protein
MKKYRDVKFEEPIIVVAIIASLMFFTFSKCPDKSVSTPSFVFGILWGLSALILIYLFLIRK